MSVGDSLKKFSRKVKDLVGNQGHIEESEQMKIRTQDAKETKKTLQEIIDEANQYVASLEACATKARTFGLTMMNWINTNNQLPVDIGISLTTAGQMQAKMCDHLLFMREHMSKNVIGPISSFLETEFADYERCRKRYEKMKVEYESLLSERKDMREREKLNGERLYHLECDLADAKTKYVVTETEVSDQLVHVVSRKNIIALEFLKSLLQGNQSFSSACGQTVADYEPFSNVVSTQISQQKAAFVSMKKDRADEKTKQLDLERKSRYFPLIEIIGQPSLDIFKAVSEVSGSEEQLKIIVRILDAHNMTFLVVKSIVTQEVEATSSPKTLFRGNTIGTKFINIYTKMMAAQYLSTLLTPFVASLNAIGDKSLELDPSRVSAGESVEENGKQLSAIIQQLMEKIYESKSSCPIRLRYVLCHLKSETNRRFPDSKLAAVGAFLFLRLISPALTSPELSGVATEAPSAQTRRTLVLITKVIQNIANGVHFGAKEDFMKSMNDVIEQNMNKTREFLNDMTLIPERIDEHIPLTTPEEAEKVDLPILHRYFVSHLEGLTENLITNQKRVIKFLAKKKLHSLVNR
eukprot:TRINITY_DN6112_c0_g1_i2.p1 TRINITY_DN6112_c0_g1~~TRINITY_DN6112_c0_g1_i2.p1  ORF type:complete len:579 (+),score=144.76 TRINITY_DN6112_c0_g1_i2:76-1812(+)